MGRLANLWAFFCLILYLIYDFRKWYPCKVVKNGDYPDKNDPFLGSVGYVCVEW
jgi:hypothetical protein